MISEVVSFHSFKGGYFLALLVLTSVIIITALAYSPILAWTILIFCSLLISDNSTFIRLFTGLALVITAAITYSSRETSGIGNDDFYYTYYPVFNKIHDNGILAFFEYIYSDFGALNSASSLEIGFYLWLYVVGLIFGDVNITFLIFLATAFGGFLYLIWIEFFLLNKIISKNKSVVLVFCLTVFSFGLCSQLSRQMFSIPFILMALLIRSRKIYFILAFTASLFHISSIPILIFCKMLENKPLFVQLTLLIFCAVSIFYPGIVHDIGFIVALDKFNYYSEGFSIDASGFDLRFILIGVSPLLLGYLTARSGNKFLGNIGIGAGLLYFLLLPLPLASYRSTLFVTAGLIGPLFTAALIYRLNSKVLNFLFISLCLFMVSRRLVGDSESGMGLWYKFDQYGTVPFYYINEFYR